ncbi:hypothetical protein ACWGIU_15605 [Streptomyces sp. NPDC054840]
MTTPLDRLPQEQRRLLPPAPAAPGAPMLRHPRHVGLRDGKPAHEVVREQPAGRTR